MAISPSTLTEPPLLRTKISIPQIPLGSINRPRLTEQVHRGVEGPLTLLAAPAGFGKTLLLLEWAKETRLPVAWLTLDSDDNDLSRFFRYLIGALQTLEAGLGEEAKDYTQSSTGGGLEVGLTLLINELSTLSKEIALVLDDFQVLENPLALQGIGFLLQYLPPNLHLVIASRSEPELDLAFLRAKGRVVEVGADELRFTGEEVERYFQQAVGLQLSRETIQALEERTDGWITSLQMAAISLKNQADPATLLANLQGNAYHLAGFLAEEILDRQPEEIRQFLLRSSILETLSGPLCEAVVNPDAQPGYGAVMLNRLEHAQLFISALDDKHEWFRYHPLFADFLRQVEAEVNPAEIPGLHQRAALWLEGNGNLGEAFRHALASRGVEWAADLIERNALPMINMGEVTALARWIGRLPEDITHKRPLLSMAYAWALIVANRLDLAQYWLDDVLQSVDRLEKQTGGTPTLEETGTVDVAENVDLAGIRGGLAVCQSMMAMARGNLEQAADFSRQAASYLSEENVYLRSFIALDESISSVLTGDIQKTIDSLRMTARIARQANNPFVMIISASETAIMQLFLGQLSKAWETLQKAKYIAIGPDGKPHPLSGFIDIVLGEILFERDLLEEAGDYLERGCKAIQSIWYLGSLGGMTSLARVRQAMGDNPGAQAIVEEIARMALSNNSGQWDDALAAGLAVRLAVQRDDLATAEQWWHKGGFPDLNIPIALEDYPYHIYEYIILAQIRFLLVKSQETGSSGGLQQAADMLGPLLLEAERLQRVNSQIQILILQAMAQSALGDEGAVKILLRALALGEPEGYRRVYLDEGWRLAELLRQCRSVQQESGSHLPSLAFLDSLLEALQRTEAVREFEYRPVEQRAGPTITHLEDGFPISLSAREMEVLALIAEGKSNQEIYAELYLALNTVKRHAYNIYQKLEVKKRTQAVSKARQLGLIP
ncbi:MAG TPA: LuxR C-terminal-related transcriptional regulator [Anaerolineales bacterium]|nr:LuxR C-terminal-related transcriptional regulator [Anaerolineales bacterium]